MIEPLPWSCLLSRAPLFPLPKLWVWRAETDPDHSAPPEKALSKCSWNSFIHSFIHTISVFWPPTMRQIQFWKLEGYQWAESDLCLHGVHLPGRGNRQHTANRIRKCVITVSGGDECWGGGEFGRGRGVDVLNRVVGEVLPEKLRSEQRLEWGRKPCGYKGEENSRGKSQWKNPKRNMRVLFGVNVAGKGRKRTTAGRQWGWCENFSLCLARAWHISW